MLVTCILPTYNRRRFIPQAIRCFLAQDYAERELIVVDDGDDCIRDLVPDDLQIRYYRSDYKQPIGKKRNQACHEARGEIIVHWDDDDWSAPWRLRYQVEQLKTTNADVCGIDRVYFYAPEQNRAWEYSYPPTQRPWVYGASLCYTRDFWRGHPFPEISVGEDNRFVWNAARARVHRSEDSRFLVAIVHGANTSRKHTVDRRYQPRDVAVIETLLGDATAFYRTLPTAQKESPAPPARATHTQSERIQAKTTPTPKPRALVAAALGIGDILRVTPLIRAVSRMGYDVDVLLSTDYPETASLIAGAPEVRNVFSIPSGRTTQSAAARAPRAEDLPSEIRNVTYDAALFTAWSSPLLHSIHAKRSLSFNRKTWLAEGDSRSGKRLACELGWQGEMPKPFAIASPRRFGLPPGTVALHPGCKSEWPWKKWHGFAELARMFPSVVVVGTDEDMRVDGTYFGIEYDWPAHVQNFVGQLNLSDTAALLRECAAVVSNDSGIMHLATALGGPTFGIFGITSPSREGLPAKNFHPVTKGLPCEEACHRGSWGRRDCSRHLECLKTLTPNEVFMKVTAVVESTRSVPVAILESNAPPATDFALRFSATREETLVLQPNTETSAIDIPTPTTPEPDRETINLTYYGYVFDASGYGSAARGYLHALHAAGIQLAVVDLANHGRQVRDPLIESLTEQRVDSDFHLFHGIPPQWARRAFPLNNVIAMTVWETDAMPSTWRPALNHATEVWLPCEYNVSAFAPALSRPVFKLPHVWRPNTAIPANDWFPHCGVRESDFVFYSIFEWQERKGPVELIEAFLRAFPNCGSSVVLVIKTNPGAASVASKALAEARRRVPSEARIELRCEAWSEEQIAALQSRGDAYISLHHGEGWNYPLFEAVGRGKAIIATGFSGPMEYLDSTVHHLVRSRPAAVRQRYAYYSTSMHWAEPDVPHAVECLRSVFEEGKRTTAERLVSAERIRDKFSLTAVGRIARVRLHDLLRRTNSAKWQRLEAAERLRVSKPDIPIPGDWYDADYFEHGRKSNWSEGYRWSLFSGLFGDTAAFLNHYFPGAKTYFDAGCAKGFLVRALREKGCEAWGVDHSAWAVEHAESTVRPHVAQAALETLSLNRHYDVLVCLDVLQSLTTEHARAFLQRVRPHITQACVAVVSLDDGSTSAQKEGDRDLARVTIQSRSAWRNLFLETGWKQDRVHLIAEQCMQNHPLPSRMGWNVLVFAP